LHPLRSLVLGLVLAWGTHAQVKEPFFFIQASDPQFGMYAANQGFAQETANFEFLVATANRLRPAFVIVTGDLVNQAGDAAETAEYLRIAARLDRSIPLYSVAGNHDLGNEPTAASLAAYRRRFGRDYYTFRVGGMAGFVLNSAIIQAPQQAPGELEKQEAWLRAELDRARKDGVRRLVVFQHHPYFINTPGEKDAYFNIPKERRAKYLALLKEYGVSHVFAGHYHQNAVASDGGLEMVTTGAVGMPLGSARSGFRVVIVRSTGIEHRYYDLGSIPNRIDLQSLAK